MKSQEAIHSKLRILMILLIMLVGQFQTGIGHDLNMATYSLHQEGECLKLQAIFDAEKIISVIPEGTVGGQPDQAFILAYMEEHFSLEANGENMNIYVGPIVVEGDLIKVDMDMLLGSLIVSKLVIFNTCLIDIDGHSNLIKLHLNNKQRMFRMDKDRTTINVLYNN